MKSIGNDIVDLSLIDKERTCLPKFYSKFLSPSEQNPARLAMPGSLPFHLYAWLLWSAKEAVYKFAKRLQPHLVFSPSKIISDSEFVDLNNFQDRPKNPKNTSEPKFSGLTSFPNVDSQTRYGTCLTPEDSERYIRLQFTFQDKNYYTSSVITSNFIFTIANNVADFYGFNTGINWIAQADYAQQAAEVRAFILNRLKALHPDQTFKIEKSEVGYPVIKHNKPGTDTIASFAHHGNYVSYAFRYL